MIFSFVFPEILKGTDGDEILDFIKICIVGSSPYALSPVVSQSPW